MDTICPRQANEATLEVQRRHVAHWREDKTCSYCGSMDEASFFAAIEAGCELTPTDKTYKAYVQTPNPNAGKPRILSSSSAGKPEWGAGWVEVTAENFATLPQSGGLTPVIGEWVLVEPDGKQRRQTFYFQHLSPEGRGKLVDLVNAGAIKFAYPGRFYVLPYFFKVEEIAANG